MLQKKAVVNRLQITIQNNLWFYKRLRLRTDMTYAVRKLTASRVKNTYKNTLYSLAGTSMTRGLSMMRAVRFPFSTIPIIQAWYPSCFSISLQYAAACSLGRQINSPPEVSAECPCNSWNMFPHAFATAAIFAITGKLWMTNETSFFWWEAKVWAWPSRPKPVTSVAP